mmetsp:Transcript_64947/g.154960  ORF Transcript_64947/g.154960 Transcript_64947/m.154960 type:complete len:408 (-) Transcript_64947:654-1877(-)
MGAPQRHAPGLWWQPAGVERRDGGVCGRLRPEEIQQGRVAVRSLDVGREHRVPPGVDRRASLLGARPQQGRDRQDRPGQAGHPLSLPGPAAVQDRDVRPRDQGPARGGAALFVPEPLGVGGVEEDVPGAGCLLPLVPDRRGRPGAHHHGRRRDRQKLLRRVHAHLPLGRRQAGRERGPREGRADPRCRVVAKRQGVRGGVWLHARQGHALRHQVQGDLRLRDGVAQHHRLGAARAVPGAGGLREHRGTHRVLGQQPQEVHRVHQGAGVDVVGVVAVFAFLPDLDALPPPARRQRVQDPQVRRDLHPRGEVPRRGLPDRVEASGRGSLPGQARLGRRRELRCRQRIQRRGRAGRAVGIRPAAPPRQGRRWLRARPPRVLPPRLRAGQEGGRDVGAGQGPAARGGGGGR